MTNHRVPAACRRAWWLVAGVLMPATAAAAPGDFLEQDVTVLADLAGDDGAGSFGWAVSELRDVDGDGAGEAMTGAPFNNSGGENAGRAYAFSGRTGAPLFTWTGEPNDALGYALADAGDVDGDGLSDILVGAPGFAGPGRAYLYAGADGELIHLFEGTGEAGSFGSAVASAGDIDGDGRADLLIGAETDPTAAMNAGRVVVFSSKDFLPLWTRDGEAMNTFLGSGTAPLGDVDADGVPDVIVGARGGGASGKGRVHVLSGVDGSDLHTPHDADAKGGNLGHFFVGGLGDLDGDDVPDVYGGDYGDNSNGTASGKAHVWSGKTGDLLYQFSGEHPGDGLGCGRGGGDQDGDGTPDLAIGAYGLDPDGVQGGGRITLYSGATGQPIRTLSGGVEQLQIGFDVVTLGDVNDDGRDDLVLSGAFLNRAFIVSGAPAPDDETTGGSTTADSPTTGTTGTADTTSDPSTSEPAVTTGLDESTTPPATTGEPDVPADDPETGCGCRDTRTGALPALLLLFALPRRRHSAAIRKR